MTKSHFPSALLVFLIVISPELQAQSVTNFSGTWTVDTAKSQPGPGGQFMDADKILRITQNAASITFATTYPSSGNFVATYKYSLDGKVRTQKRDIGTEKISSQWSADNKVLTITTVTTTETKNGPDDSVGKESYRLSDDRRTLINESSLESKQLAKITIVTVYNKRK